MLVVAVNELCREGEMNFCELGDLQYPMMVPPAMAPRLATTCVTVTALGEKLYWFCSMVG